MFGESFDKAWRKKAFSWKLGGLNLLICYVLFSERQEAGEPLVSVWNCQRWPEKDHHQSEFWWVLGASEAQISFIKLLFLAKDS